MDYTYTRDYTTSSLPSTVVLCVCVCIRVFGYLNGDPVVSLSKNLGRRRRVGRQLSSLASVYFSSRGQFIFRRLRHRLLWRRRECPLLYDSRHTAGSRSVLTPWPWTFDHCDWSNECCPDNREAQMPAMNRSHGGRLYYVLRLPDGSRYIDRLELRLNPPLRFNVLLGRSCVLSLVCLVKTAPYL